MWRKFTFMLMLSVSQSAVAQEQVDVDRSFESWHVFMDEDDCWMATYAEFADAAPEYDIYYFVTFHRRTPEPKLSLFPFKGDTSRHQLSLNVGRESFNLFVANDFAYPTDEDELEIFRHMLKDEPIAFSMLNPKGGDFNASISYSGFRDAYNYLSKQCNFRFNPGLSDFEGVEPS